MSNGLFNHWVTIDYATSFVTLFHIGNGQLFTFTEEAIPFIQSLERGTDHIDDLQEASEVFRMVYAKLVQANMIDE